MDFEKSYDELVQKNSENARQALIGKKSSSSLIRDALDQFCADAGIDDSSCGYQSREIVVAEGDLVDEIMTQSKEHECGLIVMGAREGFLTDNSIGHTIKAVMRHSKVPVMMVPPFEK
jgi:nucleotide-binding universal stress UspA family protein